ncbi:MAG TPA: SOS response-associated peptidase [Acidimicrobiales bacterium]|jgi:putative SOS response-associated peptidase YedK
MCGRFLASASADDLARWLGADDGPDEPVPPSWNVAPTDDVHVGVVDGAGRRVVDVRRWGLVPPWADDPRVGSRMINARAERIVDAPAYRAAFARRRCIVPADGFYEWRRQPGRRPAPYCITRRDGDRLAMAGVWEAWYGPREGDRGDGRPTPLLTVAVVTTAASDDVAPLHDRMPVLLPRRAWDDWLDPDVRGGPALDALVALLRPAPAGLLAVRPVGPAVNDVRNQGPHLLDPPPEPVPVAEQGRLL